MEESNQQTYIIKVGGSLLSPSENNLFDFEYANQLLDFLLHKPNAKFVLVVGGGKVCRMYQQLDPVTDFSIEKQHWIGIATINLNAELLHGLCIENAEEEIFRYKDFNQIARVEQKKHFLVTAASNPGHSSDYNAFWIAQKTNAKKIISLSNVDGVYTADPRKREDAKRLSNLTWDQYLKVIDNKKSHDPGASYPVDPVSVELAKEEQLSLYTIHGRDWKSMHAILDDEAVFEGSLLHP